MCKLPLKLENPTQTLVRLNSSISKLIHSNRYTDALHLFDQIHYSHQLKPDHYTFSSILTACANLLNTSLGDQLHSLVVRSGFKAYPHVCNTLLSLYAKSQDLCSVNKVFDEIDAPDIYSWTTLLSGYTKLGRIDNALQLFEKMPQRDVAVWNALITGSVENGRDDVALEMFRRMQLLGIKHDHYSAASVLSLCCEPELLDFGRQVHCLVVRTGLLVRVSVINAQLTMYFNCGTGGEAFQVFEEAKATTVNQITFNAMIAGLVSKGRDLEALLVFREMQGARWEPSELTFVSVFSSCSSRRMLETGEQVHGQVIKAGLEASTFVSNAAVTMYSTCGDLGSALLVFERLEDKDLVSWNTMITGYTRENDFRAAIDVFMQMRDAGFKPDDFTVGSLLACSDSGVTKTIQAFVAKVGLISNTQVCNALISAYSKHNMFEYARQIFGEMPSRNLITWNSILSGCLLNGLHMEGLELFCNLQESKLKPRFYTLTTVLSICASMSALTRGKQVHGFIIRSELASEPCLGNSLITMYAKCGVLDWSSKVFGWMSERDLVSWNSMIAAYGQHGEGKEAIQCYKTMQELGLLRPDQATFTAILSACSHAGLVDEGRQIFSSMVEDYGIEPLMDQYSCIIDLLCRSGHLDEAEKLIRGMPFQADSTIWWPLLSACAAYGSVDLGRTAAGFILEAEPNNPAVYVLLSNVYAAAEQWEAAANVRELMIKNGVMKQPGCSWMESQIQRKPS